MMRRAAGDALESEQESAPKGIDVTIPSVARMYDYYLGGKDNYQADREAAGRLMAQFPEAPVMARENRGFLKRAVRFLAAERGIDQFLDIGTGIPTAGNTHEVAQEVNPAAKVVYVDNDPIVLVHAQALMATNHQTTVIDGDLREPEKILDAAAGFLSPSRPWAIMLVAILPFIQDHEKPYDLVRTLVSRAPAGSYLAISHTERVPQLEGAVSAYQRASAQVALRTREEIAAFFTGLDMLDPGLVSVAEWRPPIPPPASRRSLPGLCAVARIP